MADLMGKAGESLYALSELFEILVLCPGEN